MFPTTHRTRQNRKAFAYVLALLLLTIFTVLSVAYFNADVLNLRQSDNQRLATEARLAAESGLSFAVQNLRGFQSEGSWTGPPDMIALARAHLSAKLDGTDNLGGQVVSLLTDGAGDSYVSVPPIAIGDNQSFSFIVKVAEKDDQQQATKLALVVTGTSGNVNRKLAVTYAVHEDKRVLTYSVASRSRIIITDAAQIDGDLSSTWDRTYISGYYIPPFETDADTAVNGTLSTVLSEEEFDEYNSESYIEGEHEGFLYDQPAFTEYKTEDFDTSGYRTGTVNITALDPPNHWDTNHAFPAPNNIRRRLDRPVYENRTFDNIYIPVGYNPKFVNCTFNRITYVDTNETKTLNDWSHGYYDEHAIPGQEYRSDDRDNDLSNNVIFDDCTFNGPVVTAVPRDYWWSKNALTFTGETTFTNSYMPQSTILAPNFGVDIGGRGYDSESNPNSKLTGIIVGGIVDIRGRANIEGTILSMYYPDTDRGSAARYYGTNIGCDDDGGETAGATGFPGDIRIVPNSDYTLPLGIRKKYTITLDATSYSEVTGQ